MHVISGMQKTKKKEREKKIAGEQNRFERAENGCSKKHRIEENMHVLISSEDTRSREREEEEKKRKALHLEVKF